MRKEDLRRLQPGEELRDSLVTGLIARGGKRGVSWLVYYRINGKERKPKIGRWPAMSLSDAREEAGNVLAKAQLGTDFSGERVTARAKARADTTMDDLLDIAMQRHWNQTRTARATKARLERHMVSRIGSMRVNQIRKADILDLHLEVTEAAGRTEANHVLKHLKTLFRLAIEWDIREETLGNPAAPVRKNRERARRVYLSDDEVARLWAACDQFEESRPWTVALIRVMLLCGARGVEIRTVRWDQVDLDSGIIELAEHKTDDTDAPRVIYIPRAAVEILRALPRYSPYVFPKRGAPAEPMVYPSKAWPAIRRAAGLEHVRLHDLRHTYASHLLSEGLSLNEVGEMLGHRSAQSTKRYQHLVRDHGRKLAEKAGEAITAKAGSGATHRRPRLVVG